MLQFKLPAAHSVRIPAGEVRGFTPLRAPRAWCHIQDSSWTGCPCGEGRDRREEPMSLLHTCFEGKVIEEIRYFLEWGCGKLGVYHQVGSCSFDTHSCFLGFHSGQLRSSFCLFGSCLQFEQEYHDVDSHLRQVPDGADRVNLETLGYLPLAAASPRKFCWI